MNFCRMLTHSLHAHKRTRPKTCFAKVTGLRNVAILFLSYFEPKAANKMTYAKLPEFLRPKQPSSLVRLGQDCDGGYLVDEKDVEQAECLLSLGINDDWSFEKAFCRLNDVDVLAFDGSTGASRFLKGALSYLPLFFLPVFFRHASTYLDYKRFFKGKRRHVRSFVGIDNPPSDLSMGRVFEMMRAQCSGMCFLKIDIEGFEYRILDDLIENSETTTALAIEFHDCDLHLDRIEAFIQSYPLHLVHVHANNYAPMTPEGLPMALELTFSSRPPAAETELALPHSKDMPNDRDADEIQLAFG